MTSPTLSGSTTKILLFAVVVFLIGTSLWAYTADDYYKAGNSFYSQGNYPSAIQYYQATVQVDPQYWQAYQALGTCEYQSGKKDDAIRDFNKSLAIHPDNPGLSQFLAQITPSTTPMPPVPTNSTAPVRPTEVDFAPEANALPAKGRFIFGLGLACDIGGYDDFQAYYGSNINTNDGVPVGVEFNLGLDYTIVPSFQVGVNFNGIYRDTEPVNITDTLNPSITEQDTWSEFCMGPALDVKYLMPMGRKFSFIIRGELGYYSLVGTTLSISASNGYENLNEVADLSSSAIGELLGVEVELRKGGIALDLGLGYRFLSFNNIQYNASGVGITTQTGTLKNISSSPNPSNAMIDFSGLNVTTTLRFF